MVCIVNIFTQLLLSKCHQIMYVKFVLSDLFMPVVHDLHSWSIGSCILNTICRISQVIHVVLYCPKMLFLHLYANHNVTLWELFFNKIYVIFQKYINSYPFCCIGMANFEKWINSVSAKWQEGKNWLSISSEAQNKMIFCCFGLLCAVYE